MRDAVIVEAVRTPVGKRNGGLSGVHPVDLSAHILRSLVDRTGVDPGLVDDVIWGCVSQVGEQTSDIARTALLAMLAIWIWRWQRCGRSRSDRPRSLPHSQLLWQAGPNTIRKTANGG